VFRLQTCPAGQFALTWHERRQIPEMQIVGCAVAPQSLSALHNANRQLPISPKKTLSQTRVPAHSALLVQICALAPEIVRI
jgi:hypothetical protein